MSQQKTITNFFPSRKRNLEIEPAFKKRKLIETSGDSPQVKSLVIIDVKTPRNEESFIDAPVFKTPTKVLSSVSEVTSDKVSRNLFNSPSKMSPSELKSKLGRVTKLHELQSRLKELSSLSSDGISSKGVDPAYRRFAHLTAPTLSKEEITFQISKSPIVSPIKNELASPRKNLGAYERFANLAAPQIGEFLPLPSEYRRLIQIFASFDQVISMKYNRKERIKVSDVLTSLRNILRKPFKDIYLEQIQCVFPKAYSFLWERKRSRFGGLLDDYELIVSPKNVPLDSFTASVLVERKNIFSNTCLSMVMDHHRTFLSSLETPIVVQDEKLMRWHRDFDPDSYCPPIDALPLPPKPNSGKTPTAQDLILKTKAVMEINSRLSNAVQNHVGLSEPCEKALLSTTTETENRFKGLNPSLVSKILAKEKAKQERELIRAPSETEEIKRLLELKNISRLLRNRFLSDKKAALPLDYASQKCVESLRSGDKNAGDVEKSLRLLSETLPEFATILKIRKMEYIKIDRFASMNDIENKLEAIKNAKL